MNGIERKRRMPRASALKTKRGRSLLLALFMNVQQILEILDEAEGADRKEADSVEGEKRPDDKFLRADISEKP